MSLTQNNDNPSVFMASVSLHSGTLPSPETVEQYELILPGAFDRILTMAEEEQKSKIKINHDTVGIAEHESRSISASILWGQTFGFISVVIIVIPYFVVLGLTVWFNNLSMFGVIAGAGVLAGLPSLVRSFQKKRESS
jgi:uncharacterized membrane protein